MTTKELMHYIDKIPGLKARDLAILVAWNKLLKQMKREIKNG